jgi:Tfp pilus assembly protein PilF
MSNYEYDRGIADLSEAIEIDPDDAGAYRMRSLAYVKEKKPTEGLADYNRAIELTRQKVNSGDPWFQ